jgi:anti-anti-sigma factor
LQSNGKINSQQDEHTLSRLASIGQISAGIAHEVRNPLTAVKGFLQLLQQETEHPYLQLASSELDNAISTLQNLLQVSKPDLDDEVAVPFSLCSEIESLLYLFQDQRYRVAIETTFSDTGEVIYGKRNQLKKALFNLLKNAHEAIPDQGRISLRHWREGNSMVLSIHDSGIGIPEEKLQLLGTPFFSMKSEGTGMGLAQVYSTIYQHGATIDVESRIEIGTTFTLKFPVKTKIAMGVVNLEIQVINGQSFKDFFLANQERFYDLLATNAQSTIDKVEEADSITQHKLNELARKLILFVDDQQHHEVVVLAKTHGRDWAKNDLPLISKLEWMQSLRKIYWDFLFTYYQQSESSVDFFFTLQSEVNSLIDSFTNHFFASYSDYKNEVLRSHRDLIDDLSVPVIPLTHSIAVLPIIGTMDTYRAKKIQELLLHEIDGLMIKKIIIDLSGVAYMDTAVVSHLFRIIEGLSLLGTKAIVTGIRSEIANTMIDLGIALSEKVEIHKSLKQALEAYGLQE